MNRFAFPVNTLPVPFQQFASDVESVFDQLFTRGGEGGEQSTGGDMHYQPRMNLVEYEDRFAVSLDLPGVNPSDVSVELKDHRLMITGERRQIESAGNAKAWRQECSWGKFRKAIQLPETIDADRVEADYENGVLTVSIPKQPKAAPRQIAVKIGESRRESAQTLEQPSTEEAAT